MGTLAGASVLPISSISSLKSKPSKCAGTGLSWRLSHEGPQGSTERPSQTANRKGKSLECGGSTVGAISETEVTHDQTGTGMGRDLRPLPSLGQS